MAINEQMEMAFADQDQKVDPVSGNEVPPGSLPEEVRDDIDARLSEGEYVVPADVVRFFGVKFFEDLRMEAKTGLAGMDAAGRIGGDPIDVPAEGGDVSEQDLAMLEQALATSGLKEGGLVNKTLNSIASQGQTDPLVNARMNAKGMTVGFAAGGMTESLYNDTTKIDTVIDKVLAAAKTNPSLLGELSKRGVTVNTTKASMKPDAMEQANKQTQTLAGGGYAPGGDVIDNMPIPPVEEATAGTPTTTSGFNPFQFGLGFSSFGTRPMAGTQAENASIMVDYYNPSTGETMQIPHDAVTNQPLQAVPAGFIMGVPPVVTAPTGNLNRGDKNDDQGPDMDAWKNKYTYSDPDALAGETLGAINKEQSGLSKFFKNSPVNQFLQATAIGELKSNIDYLEARGYDSDKIAEMKAALAVRTESRLGDTANLGSIINYALTNTSNLTNKILEEYGSEAFDFGTTATEREAQITAAGKAIDYSTGQGIVSAGADKADETTAAIEKKLGRAATEADVDKARAAGTNLLGEKLTKTQDKKSKAEKMRDKAQADKVVAERIKSGQLDKDGKAKGGRYKGGLMQKNKKKKKK
tara:strand:- start:695 stop:2440 length:1746 start_codon:yes stop_codon:yes gene_type:complete